MPFADPHCGSRIPQPYKVTRERLPDPVRTATPVANGAIWRHSAALSEFIVVFLNGLQRSVNRKVQGSNPWSGAILMSHDIVEPVSGHRRAGDRLDRLVIAVGIEAELTQDCPVLGEDLDVVVQRRGE